MKKNLFLITMLIASVSYSQITWYSSASGLPSAYEPMKMALAPDGEIYALAQKVVPAGNTLKLIKSGSAGVLWTEVSMTGLPAQIQPIDLVFSGTKLIIAAYNASGSFLYESIDNGQSWMIINHSLLNTYAFQCFAKDNNGVLFVAGQKPTASYPTTFLAKSTDNGSTWTEITMSGQPVANTIDVLEYSNGKLFMGSQSWSGPIIADFYASTNGGLNWTDVSNGIQNSFIMRDITTLKNGDIYLLGNAMTSPASVKLYNSTDATNWSEITMTGHSGMTYARSILQTNGPILMSGGGASTVTYNIFSSDLTTGINKISQKHFQVFPNPVSGNYLNLMAEAVLIGEIKRIDVISISGQIVHSYDKSFEMLNIQKLEPGIYQLRITTATTQLNERFIRE